MPTQTTYTQARANLAALMDQVSENRDYVVIQRRGAEDVALIAADELSRLLETAYLLRSKKNAERLLSALSRARRLEGTPTTIDDLRRDVCIERE